MFDKKKPDIILKLISANPIPKEDTMDNITKKLEALFSLTRNPVLGMRDGKIIFSNPAAAAFFNKSLTGLASNAVLPAHILEEASDSFLASAVVMERSAALSATRFEDVLVISISPDREERGTALFAPESLLAALRSSTLSLRLAADQILDRADTEADERLSNYASILYHSYYSLLRLTINLDTASKLAGGGLVFLPRATDITSLCRDLVGSVSHFAGAEGVTVSFESPETRIISCVDQEMIEQLILNLISNSLMHMHAGSDGQILVGLRIMGDRLVISVDDNGSGIPPEILSSVFTRYSEPQTLSQMASGAGLGLGIAKGLAELHGGSLIIDGGNGSGKGASVRVTLPIRQDTSGLHDADVRQPGMTDILRELSGWLNHGYYNGKYFD